jgi:hypothetical protein
MKQDRLIQRCQLLVARGQEILGSRRPPPPHVIGSDRVDSERFHEWRAGGLSFLQMVFGDNHPHYQTFQKSVTTAHHPDAIRGQGILKAALEELKEGFIGKVSDLVAADIFTDFLDMSKHLLESGYKDAAASLAGAVLEDGMRRICHANSIPVKGADNLVSLNQKISDAQIYSRLVQKNIQVWIDIRNNADHGNFSEYKIGDARDMLDGISRFIEEHL